MHSAEISRDALKLRYRDTYQIIMSRWAKVLSASEVLVLQYINERTFRFGKEGESIPIRHFTDGVSSKDGKVILCGLPLKRDTVCKAYKSLCEKGLVRLDNGASKHNTNRFCIIFDALVEGPRMLSKLKVGKKANPTCPKKGTSGSPKRGQVLVSHLDYKRENIEREKVEREKHTREAGLQDIVEEAKQNSRRRRIRKAKAIDTRPTAGGIVAAWKEAVILHKGRTGVPNFTTKHSAILRSNLGASSLPLSLSEFINWTVEHWSEIGRGPMKWVKDYPAIPDLAMFGRMLSHYIKAYADLQALEERGKLKVEKRDRRYSVAERENARLRRTLDDERRKRQDAELERDHAKRVAGERKKSRSKLGENEINFRGAKVPKWQDDVDYSDIPDLPEWEQTQRIVH